VVVGTGVIGTKRHLGAAQGIVAAHTKQDLSRAVFPI
jgi:hypothetical protein